jgi:hypothetical protein
MGSNKTFQQKGDRGRVLGESAEFRKLSHAVDSAAIGPLIPEMLDCNGRFIYCTDCFIRSSFYPISGTDRQLTFVSA